MLFIVRILPLGVEKSHKKGARGSSLSKTLEIVGSHPTCPSMEELINMLLSPDPEVVNQGILLLRHTYKLKQELKAWAKNYARYRRNNKFINEIDLLCKRSIPYELIIREYWDIDERKPKNSCVAVFSTNSIRFINFKRLCQNSIYSR